MMIKDKFDVRIVVIAQMISLYSRACYNIDVLLNDTSFPSDEYYSLLALQQDAQKRKDLLINKLTKITRENDKG